MNTSAHSDHGDRLDTREPSAVQPTLGRARGAIAALKPHVQPSIMAPVLVGMVVGRRGLPTGTEWLVPVAVGLFYSGAVSALNDVFDRKRDELNHPKRLLVRTRIRLRTYLALLVVLPAACGLALLGLLTPIDVLLRLLALLVVIEAMHVLYGTVPNLGLHGFVRQSLLTVGPMLLVLFGTVSVEGALTDTVLLTAVAVGFFFGAGIIVKDIIDVVGDRAANLVTIPAALGVGAAVRTSAVGHLFAFATAAVLASTGDLRPSALPFLIGALLMVVVTLTSWSKDRARPYWGVLMLAGYLSQFVFELGLVIGVVAR